MDLKTEGTEINVSNSLNHGQLKDSFGSKGEKKLTTSINFKNFINNKTDSSGDARQTEPVNKSSNFSKFLQGTTFGSYITGDKSSQKPFPQIKFQNLQGQVVRKLSKGESGTNEVHPMKVSSSKKREELNEKFAQINERYSATNTTKTPLKIVNAKLGTNLRDFMINFK